MPSAERGSRHHRPLPAARPSDRPGRPRRRAGPGPAARGAEPAAGARPSSRVLEASGLAGRGGAGFPAAIKLAVAQRRRRRAAPSWSTPWRASRPATRTSCSSSGRRISCSTARSSWPRPAAPARDGLRARGTRTRSPSAVGAGAAPSGCRRAAPRCPRSLVRPPDRFIAGEESALARWVESGESLPSFRPDKGTRPAHRAPQRRSVHNAETLAHVAMIARTGPDAFRAHGLRRGPRDVAWSPSPVPWSTPAWWRSTGARR